MQTVRNNTRGRILLIDHIERYGISKRVFAEASGISAPMLSHLLAGKRNATLAVASNIERASDGEIPMRSWLENAP
jgi:plasmid maintenance system antidote protein VapI